MKGNFCSILLKYKLIVYKVITRTIVLTMRYNNNRQYLLSFSSVLARDSVNHFNINTKLINQPT